MNTGFEFHDSVLKRISFTEDGAVLLFDPAIVHQSLGIPGSSEGDTLTGIVTMTIRSESPSPVNPEMQPGRLGDGVIFTGKNRYANVIRLPFLHEGEQIHVRLTFESGVSENILCDGSVEIVCEKITAGLNL